VEQLAGVRRLAQVAVLSAVAVLTGSAQGATHSPVSGWLSFGGGAQRLGYTPSPVGSSRFSWFYPVPATVTTQPLVARNVPRSGDLTVFAGSADGTVYAFAPNGYLRWRKSLGHLVHSCPQIPDGWGVTGTPVIDPTTRSLYVMDAFGRLHALDLATGAERRGWPVVVFHDYRQELDWGALGLAKGSVYVPTGSFCDAPPMEGKLIRVELATRRMTSWTSVPPSLGGGGSVWGWGGPSYSVGRDSIYVGTGNTFKGGTNVGKNFDEQAGFGEHVVELSRDLKVRSSSAPDLRSFADNAFVGAPVLIDRPGCDQQVAAQTKSGLLFGWHGAALSAGPVWSLRLQKANPSTPLLTEPTYSPPLRSLFIVTASQLVRISIGGTCKPKLVWSLKLGEPTLYSSPVVTGNLVWVAYPTRNITGRPEVLLGVDAGSGKIVSRRAIGGISFAQPSAVDGMLFLGVMHGFSAHAFPAAHGRPAAGLPEYSSFSDAKHGWQSREDGVYATNDGGRTWRRIYNRQAVRVVRTSARAGVISVGTPTVTCACATRKLVTLDGGRTWSDTQRISGNFQGRGSLLFWWSGGSLFRVQAWPAAAHISSRPVAHTQGTIVSAMNVPGGVVALVDRQEKAPQVIISRGATSVVTLPAAGPAVNVQGIRGSWPLLLVDGTDYAHPAAGPDPKVEWRSTDGGANWSLAK
jgi:PQQ-like domain